MVITFVTDGGFAYFPRLNSPFIVNTANLPQQQTQTLEKLIDAVSFFELPKQLGVTSQGAADYLTYTITIDNGIRLHTVKVVESSENSPMNQLISFLTDLRKFDNPEETK